MRLPPLLWLLLLVLALPACNAAGPFGGSVTRRDTSGSRVWTGDGGKATLASRTRWDFVKIRSGVQWTSGSRAWDAREVIEECERVRPTEVTSSPVEGSARRLLTLPETRTIVCIDPPVVIISPEPRTIETLGTTAPGAGEPSLLKFGWSRISLALGYLSGTRVPRRDDLTWYSPALSPAPRPVFVESAPAPIELPRGRLVFRRRADTLEVLWRPPEPS